VGDIVAAFETVEPLACERRDRFVCRIEVGVWLRAPFSIHWFQEFATPSSAWLRHHETSSEEGNHELCEGPCFAMWLPAPCPNG